MARAHRVNWQCKITASELIVDDGTRYGYRIGKGRLLERNTLNDGGTVYDWPMHLAGKGWCSGGLFREAFLEAVKQWRLVKFDHEIWDRTVKHLKAHPRGWI